MSELNNNVPLKVSSEKGFGFVFTLFFMIISFYPILYGNNFRLWSFIIGVLILSITLIKPNLLNKPNLIWFRIGILLGKIVSPIVLTSIYLIVVIPTNIIMRLVKYDPLKLKIDKNVTSYWIKRESRLESMKNQF